MKYLIILSTLLALCFLAPIRADETVEEIEDPLPPDGIETSLVLYSSDFAEEFFLEGDFEVEIVGGNELFTAVGFEPHFVDVFTTNGVETLEIPTGTTVGYRNEADGTLLLAIDGNIYIPLPWFPVGQEWPGQPQTYASGTWTKVTYHGFCLRQTASGYDCGGAGKRNGCQARVYVPNGDTYLHTAHCGNASKTVRFLGGSLDINF